jgi:hypothetical protein
MATATLSNDLSLSIIQPEVDFSVTVFPNPTMDGITLDLNAGQNLDLRLDLFDVTGKQMPLSHQNLQLVGNAQRQIDMSGFASGIYFIRLIDDTGNLNKTIKVKKVN